MPNTPSPNDIIVEGDIARMFMTKRNGEIVETVFDADDVLKVQSVYYRWFAHYERRMNNYYVAACGRTKGERDVVFLSRLITDCPEGFVVDHIDHNTLNNRKSNLRIVTQNINLQNKSGAYRSSKTGVRGVTWHKATGKWYAQVNLNSRKVFSQLFETFEDACEAVEKARKRIFKEGN